MRYAEIESDAGHLFALGVFATPECFQKVRGHFRAINLDWAEHIKNVTAIEAGVPFVHGPRRSVVLRCARGFRVYTERPADGDRGALMVAHVDGARFAPADPCFVPRGFAGALEELARYLTPAALYVRLIGGKVAFQHEPGSEGAAREGPVAVTFLVSGEGAPPEEGIVWPEDGPPRLGALGDRDPGGLFTSWPYLRYLFDLAVLQWGPLLALRTEAAGLAGCLGRLDEPSRQWEAVQRLLAAAGEGAPRAAKLKAFDLCRRLLASPQFGDGMSALRRSGALRTTAIRELAGPLARASAPLELRARVAGYLGVVDAWAVRAIAHALETGHRVPRDVIRLVVRWTVRLAAT
jgi:hypothetical protein